MALSRVRRAIALSGGLASLSLCVWAWQPGAAKHRFTARQRLAVLWRMNRPGFYETNALLSQASITPAASRWFDAYARLKRAAASEPSRAAVSSASRLSWEEWVARKLERDWAAANAGDEGGEARIDDRGLETPPELSRAIGPAPAFAGAVTPTEHRVRFSEAMEDEVVLRDHPNLGRRFRSYRFPTGVMDVGVPLIRWRPDRVLALMARNGLTPPQSRALLAVSELEGGFDAINTYDTGFLSVGFVQFSAGQNGNGALVDVLESERRDDPPAFQGDFRDAGIDAAQGVLHVVDPRTGLELAGADAVACVVREPRLAAVFVRAGRRSAAFQGAQLRSAIRRFYPDDVFSVRLVDGRTISGSATTVVRSEAGVATLLDGKINTGRLSQTFQTAVQEVALERHAGSWQDLARYEREILRRSTNRASFLGRSDLSQPRREPANGGSS